MQHRHRCDPQLLLLPRVEHNDPDQFGPACEHRPLYYPDHPGLLH